MRSERTSSGAPVEAARSTSATTQPSAYLLVGEVAEILQVSPKTVCRWAMDGKLPFQRTLGGHRRYPEHAIRELAASLQVQPS
jgi:excisionase family DNA binding protein